MSLLDSLLDAPVARPVRHFVAHNHALAVGLAPMHVHGCDACVVAMLLAEGVDSPCPYAYTCPQDGWLECDQPLGHAGDCTPV